MIVAASVDLKKLVPDYDLYQIVFVSVRTASVLSNLTLRFSL